MTKTIRMGAAGAAIAFAMTMGGVAQAQESASADAKVEVLKPLSFENTADLDFAAVAVNGGGTAAMGIDAGAADLDCSANLVCVGTPSLAAFRVFDGSPGRTVTLEMPSDIDLVHTAPVDVANPTAGEVIELSDYVTDATENTTNVGGVDITTYSVDLGGSGAGDEGEATFSVGGTLTFDGSEIAGEYEGTFDVSVEYS